MRGLEIEKSGHIAPTRGMWPLFFVGGNNLILSYFVQIVPQSDLFRFSQVPIFDSFRFTSIHFDISTTRNTGENPLLECSSALHAALRDCRIKASKKKPRPLCLAA
jgi:hypothetical protein